MNPTTTPGIGPQPDTRPNADAVLPTTFGTLPAAVRAVWAKSGELSGHGLLAHLLDVAAVAETILRFEPTGTSQMLSRSMGVPPTELPRWVGALAGLHDLGKAIAGFQAKWKIGQQVDEAAGLSFPAVTLRHEHHSLATAALLVPLLERVSGAGFQWCQAVVQAVSAHHGYHFTADEVQNGKPLREPGLWRDARGTLIDVYWAVLSPSGRPTDVELSLPTVNWLAGLTSAADWIASNPAWFPPGERRDGLVDYHQDACALADAALRQIGWRAWQPLLQSPSEVDNLLQRIVQRSEIRARPLQVVADALLQQAQGPALLLVEAPMGEGKTELAFLAHLRLQAKNEHRGLYMALPSQATGNALFRRAQTFLASFAQGGLDVQLIHGGAAMNEDLAQLRDVDHSTDATLSASAWFGQRRRPLLSAYGVGTVDQALYSVLNVKHHFVRLWGLSNRVVVLDEVHAYDTYTGDLIVTLLRWLKALGCSVVLMSATLPHARARGLMAAWGASLDSVTDLAYPRLTLVDDHGVHAAGVPARPLAPITLSGIDNSLDSMADAALAAVGAGGCGALIVNTVARAQRLYLAIHARLRRAGRVDDTAVLLVHARFPADERAALEARVVALFGEDGQRPARALLVATQVVEQSLDIDFDFMFSDLAPVDLLLQRVGRLHRHRRVRPESHAAPHLRVAGLMPDTFPDLKGTAWGFVYDPYILGRTWALLRHEPRLTLPDDIDRLVQAVYDHQHPLPPDLDTETQERILVEQFGAHLAEVKAQRQLAWGIALDPAEEPHRAYDTKPRGHEEDEMGMGLTNTTRLGEPSITLIPVWVGNDSRWHVRQGDPGFLPDQVLDGPTARALYNRQIKVSRRRVVKHFMGQRQPPAFAAHALLRHAHALPLLNGRYVDPTVTLVLCPELGLSHEDPRVVVDAEEGVS